MTSVSRARATRLVRQLLFLGRIALISPRIAIVVVRVKLDGRTFLSPENLFDLVRVIRATERRGLPGSIVEAGTAWGGSAIVMTAAKRPTRSLVLFDAFSAPPEPTERDGADVHERFEIVASGRATGVFGRRYYGYAPNLFDDVQRAFERFGVPSGENAVEFVPGYYEETMRIDFPVALAHIDCDRHDSVDLAVRAIWPRLVVGGRLVIDDYAVWSGATRAIDEFLRVRSDFEVHDGSKLHIVKTTQ